MLTTSDFKGQSSMEFMAMVFIMLVMLTVTISVLRDRQSNLNDRRESLKGLNIGDRVANEIDMALTFGKGYYRDFELDKSIRGNEYSVEVEPGYVVVSWKDRTVYSSTAIDHIDGEIEPGENTIKNLDGDIVIE